MIRFNGCVTWALVWGLLWVVPAEAGLMDTRIGSGLAGLKGIPEHPVWQVAANPEAGTVDLKTGDEDIDPEVYGDFFTRRWSVMYHHGWGSSTDLGQTLVLDIDSEDSQFYGFAVNRKMFPFWKYFSFELEAQVIKHFDKQTNWEYNGLFILRWHPFFFEDVIDVDLAAGEGLSYADHTPVIEEEQHPGGTSHLMNYLVFEFAFTLPQYRPLTLVTRIHHRSGVFGTFNGSRGGSNFFVLGLRYHF